VRAKRNAAQQTTNYILNRYAHLTPKVDPYKGKQKQNPRTGCKFLRTAGE
jgi:hypothetical protein